mmetsp:Transcript_10724/g.24448  ORF Transcript_10724/g.24448 Transcript_10724/m.24448 type:complete len:1061 (+) Transcript_10724:89-3271(+)
MLVGPALSGTAGVHYANGAAAPGGRWGPCQTAGAPQTISAVPATLPAHQQQQRPCSAGRLGQSRRTPGRQRPFGGPVAVGDGTVTSGTHLTAASARPGSASASGRAAPAISSVRPVLASEGEGKARPSSAGGSAVAIGLQNRMMGLPPQSSRPALSSRRGAAAPHHVVEGAQAVSGVPGLVGKQGQSRPTTPTPERRVLQQRGGPGSLQASSSSTNTCEAANAVVRQESGAALSDASTGCGSVTGQKLQAANAGSRDPSAVISSALEYKRFVARRRQEIQQQVVNLQQGNSSNTGTAAGHQSGLHPAHLGDEMAQPTGSATMASQALSAEPPILVGELETTEALGPSSSSMSGGLTGGRCIQVINGLSETAPSGTVASAKDGGQTSVPSNLAMSLPVGGARQACRSLGQCTAGDREALASLATAQHQPPVQQQGAHRAVDGTTVLPDTREAANSNPQHSQPHGHTGKEQSPLAGQPVESFAIGRQVGQGAYATVFLGLHKDSGIKVAVKIYEKHKLVDSQRRKSVRNEIHLLERLKHPNIVVFHDALETAKQIYLVMEFVSGGSLHHFLKKRPGRHVDEGIAKQLFFQVCQGVKYLHHRRVVHRDIKLENLLLDEQNTVKIIDFGFSTIVPPGKKLKVFCGTPSYMAPEIVSRKEYTGFCADIWAAGVLLHALLCGCFPFKGQNDRDLYRKIVRAALSLPDTLSEATRTILTKILTADMAKRPTVDEVLADSWLVNHKDDLYTAWQQSRANAHRSQSAPFSTSSSGGCVNHSGPPRPASSQGHHSGAAASHAMDGSHDIAGVKHVGGQDGGGLGSAAAAGSGGSASTGACPVSRVPSAARSRPQVRQPAPAAAADAASSFIMPVDLDSQPFTTYQVISGPPAPPAAPTLADGAIPKGREPSSSAVAAAPSAVPAAALPPSQGHREDEAHQPCIVPVNRRGGTAPGQADSLLEEEAVRKLERLGYPKEEIARQLRDESSHLRRLYDRFLKTLPAWDGQARDQQVLPSGGIKRSNYATNPSASSSTTASGFGSGTPTTTATTVVVGASQSTQSSHVSFTASG